MAYGPDDLRRVSLVRSSFHLLDFIAQNQPPLLGAGLQPFKASPGCANPMAQVASSWTVWTVDLLTRPELAAGPWLMEPYPWPELQAKAYNVT